MTVSEFFKAKDLLFAEVEYGVASKTEPADLDHDLNEFQNMLVAFPYGVRGFLIRAITNAREVFACKSLSLSTRLEVVLVTLGYVETTFNQIDRDWIAWDHYDEVDDDLDGYEDDYDDYEDDDEEDDWDYFGDDDDEDDTEAGNTLNRKDTDYTMRDMWPSLRNIPNKKEDNDTEAEHKLRTMSDVTGTDLPLNWPSPYHTGKISDEDEDIIGKDDPSPDDRENQKNQSRDSR